MNSTDLMNLIKDARSKYYLGSHLTYMIMGEQDEFEGKYIDFTDSYKGWRYTVIEGIVIIGGNDEH